MKKIYVCSPLAGDIEGNIKRAIEFSKFVTRQGCLPITPHIYCTQFLDDTVPEERLKGLEMGIELLKVCDELWVFGSRISNGMEKEIELWNRDIKKRVVYFDENLIERTQVIHQ